MVRSPPWHCFWKIIWPPKTNWMRLGTPRKSIVLPVLIILKMLRRITYWTPAYSTDCRNPRTTDWWSLWFFFFCVLLLMQDRCSTDGLGKISQRYTTLKLFKYLSTKAVFIIFSLRGGKGWKPAKHHGRCYFPMAASYSRVRGRQRSYLTDFGLSSARPERHFMRYFFPSFTYSFCFNICNLVRCSYFKVLGTKTCVTETLTECRYVL